jgi:hypothetical protein
MGPKEQLIATNLARIEAALDSWGFRADPDPERSRKKADILSWLDNFRPSEIPDALLILDQIQYKSDHVIRNAVSVLARDLKQLLQGSISRTAFLPLGTSSSSSGTMYLYDCRKALGLPEGNFPLQRLDEVLASFDSLVVFDDIIGSGKQATRFFKDNLSIYNRQIFYAAVFAFQSGLTRVRSDAGFTEVLCGHLISDEERAFTDDTAVFPDPVVRERVKQLALGYGQRLYRRHPLGYDHSQALLVFPHNTPNNTLPIIWAGPDNEKTPTEAWNPLWQRRKLFEPASKQPISAETSRAPRQPGQSSGGAQPRRLRPLDYTNLLKEKTRNFAGRQWLFDSIDQFLSGQSSGYVIVTGGPGIGKTAVAAELVHRRSYTHHFNVASEGLNRFDVFLNNLYSQLALRFRLKIDPPNAKDLLDSRYIRTLLDLAVKSLPSGDKLIVVVDALDEVDSADLRPGTNPFCLPASLADSLFIVLTTRDTAPELRIDCESIVLRIAQDSADNIRDVELFLRSSLERPGVRRYLDAHNLTEDVFVAEFVDRSEGNFMYLRYVIGAIATGVEHDRSPSSLPRGLQNYYEDHWRRMRSNSEDEWFTLQLPVLLVLTVVAEPVTISDILDLSNISGRARLLGVIEKWGPFLHETKAGHMARRYRLYHNSFREFISAKQQVQDERVSLTEAHGQVAKQLISRLLVRR